MNQVLLGQHQIKVSLKGRAAFPKKFREILGNKVIITRGYEGCLIAVSQSKWQTLIEGTGKKPFVFGPSRDTSRFLLGNAALVELDDQGRFVLPPHLREYSEIKEEAIFLGLNKYVEIWSRDKWKEYQTYLSKNIDQISERLNLNED
jgi:MraZ protein